MRLFLIFSSIFLFLLFLFYVIYNHFFMEIPNILSAEDAEDERLKLGWIDISAHYIKPKIYQNFISDIEAKYIIKSATPNFADSTIVSGTNVSVRKSQTSTLNNNDPIIRPIIQRVCDIVGYPFENVEPIQIVKYDSDGYYNEHYDSCPDKNDFCRRFVKDGGQRAVTMVLYLNDQFTGGATKFINLEQEFKPAKYGGILFYSMDTKKTKTHPLSLHAGTPLTSGTKYIANIWIRENKYM